MAETNNPPVFPVHAANAVRRRLIRQFADSEMRTDEDVEHLLELLYRQPEVATYSFHPQGRSMNARLLAAEHFGRLQVIETQSHWYAHPNFERDFVRVRNGTFDWEKELLASGAMLYRNELALTLQERRRREIEDTAAAIARVSQPNPTNRWQRLEQHYRRNSAAYYGIGLLLAVIGLAVAL